MLISNNCLYLFISQIVQKSNDSFMLLLFSSTSIMFKQTIYYVPSSHFSFQPLTYPSTDKPYPPAILVKHHTWFLHDVDLFICCDHILYGVHQSHFDQSPLFREIILYGRTNEIGVNPHHPILFDTLTKEIFNNLLYVLYFGTEHLEHLTPEDWLNIKRLSTDWHFP
jgi:hypothetical protein